MSDVVVPSFFPTPSELAGGLRWVQQHPVVATAAAAAAATAVSVLSYLKAATSDDDDDVVDRTRADLSPCNRHMNSSNRLDKGEEVCSSTESDTSTPSRDRSLSPCSLSFGQLGTVDETGAGVEYSDQEHALHATRDGGGIASPQWGWYVSTTPPEDHY
ncbi:unnamed protein product [Hyaloperonospora brassicae]|uniref:RxLR effector candidate protein n=1 Tax=Hyaloperonospora brassicae TaxID=162125 RepID=A0AAV0UYU3_HYABA|nr:unnamed protein product [Hyaloperonospora brassicae]